MDRYQQTYHMDERDSKNILRNIHKYAHMHTHTSGLKRWLLNLVNLIIKEISIHIVRNG